MDAQADVIVRRNVQANNSFDEVRDSTGPEHLCASVKKAAKRWAGLLAQRMILITVARPRGSHTRFPILPSTRGTQTFS
jgi:hypothetical protein